MLDESPTQPPEHPRAVQESSAELDYFMLSGLEPRLK